MSGLGAVILAGGRATRLGGVSKPDLMVGGQRLLTTAISAARAAGCERIVVVGPPELRADGCLHVQEDPPFGGPVAGLAAGLGALGDRPEHVLVLACDMPEAGAAVARLTAARAADPDADGVCLVDASGRTQWLAAIYSRAALDAALDAAARPEGDRAALHGAAMRRLAASLDLVTVADGGSTHDIDTWGDLARATGPEGTP
ncbi:MULTISPECIES: molybdenum cofactor guanylyltransferase [unclassified Agromyces]|uniref:molybdenum cofactor guanylyltransferase n=1 Tax=unclassified Agromyces TaxID=2639701 RepID=UPI00301508FE